MKKIIQLKIRNRKIAFAVSINGIFLVVNRFHQLPVKQVSINQWVWAGANECNVNISINPQLKEELADQSFELKIVEYSGDSDNYSRKDLKTISWKYEKDMTAFPVNINKTFNCSLHNNTWLWKTGEELTEDTIDFISLRTFISNVHLYLASKNYNQLVPILQTKATELANAYNIPLTQRLQNQKSFFEEDLFSSPQWNMLPLDFKKMEIIFHDSGKLIEIVDKNGLPFLRSTDIDETFFSLPLRLSYIDKNWVLCR